MDNPSNIWSFYSTIPNITTNSSFSWNMNLNRIIGCMNENDFDNLENSEYSVGLLGLTNSSVMWDANMFDALVSGTIGMGNYSWNISGNNYRGYGDMNWGQNFISKSDDPTNPQKYYWGWISASNRNNNNPTNDLSIIAAYGNDADIMGLDTGMSAVFASAYNVLNHNICWKFVKTEPFGLGVNLIDTCNWGSGLDCYLNTTFTADNFFNYTDIYGSAPVPAHQQMILENEYCRITMDAYVNSSCISRLLTPNSAGIWSNFEALGAICHVKIKQKHMNGGILAIYSPSIRVGKISMTLQQEWNLDIISLA